MLVAVVLFFIICWSPILIINILTSIGIINPLSYGYLKPLRTIAHLLSYVNSCINPIIHGLMSKNFRASFHAVLSSIPCFSFHKGNQQPNRSNSNYASSYRINSTQPTRATSVWTQRWTNNRYYITIMILVLIIGSKIHVQSQHISY